MHRVFWMSLVLFLVGCSSHPSEPVQPTATKTVIQVSPVPETTATVVLTPVPAGSQTVVRASPVPAASPIYVHGILKTTEKDSLHATIQHDGIPQLNAPAGEMRFRMEDPEVLAGIKPGDTVNATVKVEGPGDYVVTTLSHAPK